MGHPLLDGASTLCQCRVGRLAVGGVGITDEATPTPMPAPTATGSSSAGAAAQPPTGVIATVAASIAAASPSIRPALGLRATQHEPPRACTKPADPAPRTAPDREDGTRARTRDVAAYEANLLDPINLRLLKELQADGRLGMAELGRRIEMSAPAVAERVQRLERAGVIVGYRALLWPPFRAAGPAGVGSRV
jgi:hypothetical protein